MGDVEVAREPLARSGALSPHDDDAEGLSPVSSVLSDTSSDDEDEPPSSTDDANETNASTTRAAASAPPAFADALGPYLLSLGPLLRPERPGSSTLDSALDEETVVRLYNQTLGNVRVSITLAGGTEFSVAQTLALAGALAASVPMTRAMGRTRGDAPLACLPHLSVVLSREADVPSKATLLELRGLVRAGLPLSPARRALLLTLPDLEMRLQWAVAWVINRCRSSMRETRRAALPLVFRPLGGRGSAQHVNLISFTFSPHETLLELFEPDGPDFYRQGGLGAYFGGLGEALARQSLVRHQVRFRPVGKGVQTALGEWRFRAEARGGVTVLQRGYPVCGAVCVWAFSRFLASRHSTLGAYDETLYARLTRSRGERHAMQRDFERFLVDMSEWVASHEGRGAVSEALRRHFHGSNVASLRVVRGGDAAAAPPLVVDFLPDADPDVEVLVRQLASL